MQAVRIHRFGGPDVLTVDEVPVPDPGPGEVLVRVEAAAVNFADVMRRRADPYPFPTPLPFTPGSEVAGTVEALGEGVAGPPPGTPVLALVGADGSSGYAQYAVAAADRVIPIPDGVGAEAAAGIIVAGTTAMLLLTEAAPAAEGAAVLIPGAAGGVGSVAVQLASRVLGAGTVIGLAGSPARRARVLELGAHHALDSADPAWPEAVRELTGGRGADVALEMAGGETFARTLGVLAPLGRMAVYGLAGGQPPQLDGGLAARWLYDPALNQSITAFNLGAWFGLAPERAAAALGRLLALVAEGRVHVPVGEVLSLDRAADAHRLLEGRAALGKVVLAPWA